MGRTLNLLRRTSLLLFPLPAIQLCAAPVYYLNATAAIQTDLPTTTLGGGGLFQQSGGTVGNPVQTFYSMAPLSHSDSVTAFDPIANGLYTVTASASVPFLSIDGPVLRASAFSNGGSSDPYVGSRGSATAELFWVDTVWATGVPNGTPVLLRFTFSLDGSYTVSGKSSSTLIWNPSVSQPFLGNVCGLPADYVTQINGDTTEFTNTSAPIIHDVQTLDFCTTAGTELGFEEQLSLNPGGNAPAWSAAIDASDTAEASIDVLTPGASLASASGIDYSTTAAPAPPTWLLVLAPLLVCVRMRIARS